MILAEVDRLPVGFLEDVLEARSYARAKAAWDQNPKASGGLVDLVKAITFEQVQEELTGG